MDVHFTTQVFKEGRSFVAHTPQLDVSSCGTTRDKAIANLQEAVRLFLEEADRMGTLDQILEEAGYSKGKNGIRGPLWIGTGELSISLPGHAEP